MKYSSIRKRGLAILLGAILAAGGTGMAVSAENVTEGIADEEITEGLNDINGPAADVQAANTDDLKDEEGSACMTDQMEASDVNYFDIDNSDLYNSDNEFSDNITFGEMDDQTSEGSDTDEAQASQTDEETWDLVLESAEETEPAWQEAAQGEAGLDMDTVPSKDGDETLDSIENGYAAQDSTENDAAAADSTDQPESAPEAPVKPVMGLIYNEMPQMLVEPAIQMAAVQTAAVQTETAAESAGPDAKIIMYSLDGQTFTEEIPTATNAGEYTVWYKVIDVTSQQTTETGTVTATIEKAEVQLIAPTAR